MIVSQKKYELTDFEWHNIESYLPKQLKKELGHSHRQLRKLINAIVWVARSGSDWQDLPTKLGDWRTVYIRFLKWQKKKLLNAAFKELDESIDLEKLQLNIHSGSELLWCHIPFF